MAMLIRGSQGDNVRNIQGMLYQAGLYEGAIDGFYGPKTEQAVKDWQKYLDLKTDGMWGVKTLDATVTELGRVNSGQSVSYGMPVVPNLKGRQ